MAQTSTLSIKCVTALTRTVDFGTSKLPITIGADTTVASGTSAGACDTVYALEAEVIAASGTLDIDLSAALTDPLGGAAVFAKVDAIILKASLSNTNNIHIGGDSAGIGTLFGNVADYIVVKPGGMIAIWGGGSGYAITATTGDILQIANGSSGSGVTFDLLVLGRSV